MPEAIIPHLPEAVRPERADAVQATVELIDISMKKLINVSLFIVLIISTIACAQKEKKNTMQMTEFIEKYNSDSTLVVLDVRTEKELSGSLGKLDKVINIPVQVLAHRIDELSKYKENEIAVICRTGNRSDLATEILRAKGFNARNVLGGMVEYRRLASP
jgi:rhodanese-related sulfurtransferase